MRRQNTSTQSLKERIADALIRLLSCKPFDKITIQEITTLAKVGRATYFRNFSSKYEVITFKLVQLWERWAKQHQLTEKSKYSFSNIKYFFEFNLDIKSLHQILYASHLQSAVYSAFYQIMVPPNETDPLKLYRNRFLSYGLFGLLDEWIRRGYRETPGEMAALVTQKILA